MMDTYYKKHEDGFKGLNNVSSFLKQMLTVRRWHRGFIFILVVSFIFLLYKWLSPAKMPNSAIFCKNRVAELVWPKLSDRSAAIDGMVKDVKTLENEFYTFLGTQRRQCFHQRHLGPQEEGGWDVCLDEQFTFHKPCLIYSFGIGHDFRFESEAEKIFGCEIHTFDPSMGLDSYQHSDRIFFHNYGLGGRNGFMVGGKWEIRTLKSILAELGHFERDIDYMKIDVEFSEWQALREMYESGTLKKIRQLAVEIHTPEMDMLDRPNHKCTWCRWDSLAAMMSILYDLQNTGFEIYYSRPNHRIDFQSGLTGIERLCCYNLHLINLQHPVSGWRPPPTVKLKQQSFHNKLKPNGS